jgi:hypothetical protein
MTSDAETKGFEEGLMVMALIDARFPDMVPHTRSMRSALLYGEARRRLRKGDRGQALRYARSAALSSGPAGHIRLLRHMLDARWGRAASA